MSYEMWNKACDFLGIGGGSSPLTYEIIHKYSRGLCIDLGTCLGHSAYIMALKAAKVITIDMFFEEGSIYKKHEGYRYEKVKGVLEKLKNITVVKGDAADKQLIKLIGNKKIDLLYIDCVHDYGKLSDTFNNWSKYLKKDGYVIFNDFKCYWGTDKDVFEELTRFVLGLVEKDYIMVDKLVNAVVLKKE